MSSVKKILNSVLSYLVNVYPDTFAISSGRIPDAKNYECLSWKLGFIKVIGDTILMPSKIWFSKITSGRIIAGAFDIINLLA